MIIGSRRASLGCVPTGLPRDRGPPLRASTEGEDPWGVETGMAPRGSSAVRRGELGGADGDGMIDVEGPKLSSREH